MFCVLHYFILRGLCIRRYEGNQVFEVKFLVIMSLIVVAINILMVILEKFSGGPVGLDTLAAALGEDRGTLEEGYVPFLIKSGLLQRTPRGRVVTERARAYLQ